MTLPGTIGTQYGDKLGADLSDVNIHVGDGVAREYGADAVTLGSDIHFETGKYNPDAAAGSALLGHELAHTVQQHAVPTIRAPERPGSELALENEADQASSAVRQGQTFEVSLAAPSVKQYQVATPAEKREPAVGPESDPSNADDVDVEDPTERALTDAEGSSDAPEGATLEMADDAEEAPSQQADAAGPETGGPGDGGGAGGGAADEPNTSGGTDAGQAMGAPPSVGVAAGVMPTATLAPPRNPTNVGDQARQMLSAPIAVQAPSLDDQEPERASVNTLAVSVSDAGAALAERVRQAAERVSTDLQSHLEQVRQRIRSAREARLDELESNLQANTQSLSSVCEQAVSAIAAGKSAQLQVVEQALGTERERLQSEADGHKETSQASADQLASEIAAHGESEAARAHQASANSAQEVQSPGETSGEAASTDAQGKADRKIGDKAARNFQRDGQEMSGRSQRAASAFASTCTEQVSQFHSEIDGLMASSTGALEEHASTTKAGIENAAAQALSGIYAVHDEAVRQLQREHSAAASTINEQANALEESAEHDTGAALDQFAPKAVELARELAEGGAEASGSIVASGDTEQAAADATNARATLEQGAALGIAQLRAAGDQHIAALDVRMVEGLGDMANIAQDACAAADQTRDGVTARIQEAQAGAVDLMAESGDAATSQMSEANASACNELATAAERFNTELAAQSQQARADISTGVDSALAEQQSNQGQVENQKEGAKSQIGSKYATLKSEAERDSRSEQANRRGQRGFWGSLVSGWNKLTSWCKKKLASAFGDWLGGFIYGVLSAIVGLAIIIGTLALIAATGPIGAAIALGLGIAALVGFAGYGIYNRFQMFKAYNERSPGWGEGTLLVLLGIADVTGAPQIVEGLVGHRAFSNGHEMSDFEAGENVGSGLVQLVATFFLIRGLKGKAKGKTETKPNETKPNETKPNETKPNETKPNETKPNETKPNSGGTKTIEELLPKLSKKAQEGLKQQRELLSEKNFEQMKNAYRNQDGTLDVARAEKLFEKKWMSEADYQAKLKKVEAKRERPDSWKKFDPELDAQFKAKLKQFRGDEKLDVPDGFRGGEGQLFLSKQSPLLALKRWFKSRVKDMGESVRLLEEAASAVESNPKLESDVSVVKIHERGPDWVIRDFSPRSVKLSSALSDQAVVAARQRVIDALQGTTNPTLRNLLQKLTRQPPSDNLHWSPSQKKILIIDMQ